MRSPIIPFTFTLIVSAAAYAANTHPAANAATAKAAAAPAPAQAAPAAPKPAPARAPELIATAAAVTHDGQPAVHASPTRVKDHSEDKPRRTGSAMLLAALALMSGIALRRYSARGPR